MIQAQAVAQAMVAANPSLEPPTMVVMYASGDTKANSNIQDAPLALQSVPVDFTGSLDQALIDGTIDVAVHSLKDIPPTRRWQKGQGLVLAYPLPREDPADVLVGPYGSLWDIPSGSKIGTSSIRRQAQLKSLFYNNHYKKKDIQVVNIRGNLDSRLRALEEGVVDALILAQSGLNRLERHNDELRTSTELSSYTPIPTNIMLPGVCQGIVAAAYRPSDDTNQFEAWFPQNHESLMAASAERAFLDALDESSPWAGRPPLAGLMEQKTNGDKNNTPSSWTFRGLLARPDGSRVLETTGDLPGDCTKADAEELGTQAGLELLAQSGGIKFYD
jgi:hydroxymethylbilane synthase